MGQWTIVIHGTGAHHNWATTPDPERPETGGHFIIGRKNDYDADLMFAEFVDQLRACGHNITGSTFTHGGMEGPDSVIRRDFRNPHLPDRLKGVDETQQEAVQNGVADDYIRDLDARWADAPKQVPEPDLKTLIFGNIRGFYGHLVRTGRLK